MKWLLLTALSVLVFTPVVGAIPITIYNTGVNNSNVVLATGTIDPHYLLTTSADPTGPGPNAYVDNTTAFPIPPWIGTSSTSAWITPTTNAAANLNAGNYVFTTTFMLPVGFTSASLSGQWATDNSGTMQLNGNSVGTPSASFSSFTAFSITTSFLAGTNTLSFTVNNAGTSPSPIGLRVEISGAYTPAGQVPEPSSLATITGGLIALGAFARRFRARP